MKKSVLLLIPTLWVWISGIAQVPQLTDNAVQGTGLNQHNYVGAGWTHNSTTSSFYNNTLSFSNVAGAYLTFTFEGSAIEWYTEKKNWHGIAAVSIDGGSEILIDLYSSTEQHSLVYSSSSLEQGTHTIKIRATGTKNPASIGTYTIHDFFKVYQQVSSVSAPFRNTSTGIGALEEPQYIGGSNSAFGYHALNSSSLNYGNTAVGSEALTGASKTNDRNTAVGYRAMYHGPKLQGGSSNTAVGANALEVIDAGAHNTAIGADSGPVEGPVLIGTTALGAGAKTTADGQVRIGDHLISSIGGNVSWSTLSDGRFKKDLREDVSGLDFVKQLRPVSYMVDKTSVQKFLGIPDSLVNSRLAKKEIPRRQTGFVAQEVDALVKKTGYVFHGVDAPKNEKDPYTIRYAEFVVPLVKAVQELSAKNEEQLKMIADQQNQIAELINRLEKVENGTSGPKSTQMSLLQNTPNPFSVDTEIKMVLPETAVNATVIVYNLEGKQVRELEIEGRGHVSATIFGNQLGAGMYIYTLIVDGTVVDTKRMILTK
ncbi:MAG TPA: tail fiber domain-containing protein [Chryseolinea sp.]